MTEPAATAAKSGFPWKWLFHPGAAIALIAAGICFQVQDLLRPALAWVDQPGPWSAIIFIAIYVVATVLLIPGSVLTLFVKGLMQRWLAWQR